MVVVLQLLENSCSFYNNKCITKLWVPDLTFSIYTWFSWHCFHTLLWNSFQCSFCNYKLVWTFQTHWVKYSTQYIWIIQKKYSSEYYVSYHNYLTPLLLSPHTIRSSFRYEIDEVLGLWYCMGWYFWLLFLWMCWRLFGTLWWWNVLQKFWFTMGSIMEWAVDMSTSNVSRVSNTSSIVDWNIIESWFLCGRNSNFLYSSSKLVL